MLYRLRTDLARARFDAGIKDVLDTPPLQMREAPVTFVSQLRRSDVLAWLVAIKSVYRQIGRGNVVVLDDGSLTSEQRVLITRHVPLVSLRPLEAGRIDGLPTGGTWERLCIIGQEAITAFTIQVDADLVCCGPMDAVNARIDANTPFALADGPVPGRRTAKEIAIWNGARPWREDHVQNDAELAFAKADLPDDAHYLRGTSAFAGFPLGADILPGLLIFADAMRAALGDDWDRWGTEQVASNYAIANAGPADPLVPPTYVNHTPAADLSAASLIHFYGTHRFVGGRYLAAAQQAVAALGPP